MANNHRKFHKNKKSFLDESYVPPFGANVLQQSIDTLKLSDAVTLKLRSGKIETIFDVVRREEKDFYRIPTFDKKNLGEVKNALNNRRLFLKPPAPKPEVKEETKKEVENKKPNTGASHDKTVAKAQPVQQKPKEDKSNKPKENVKPKKDKRILDPDGISEKRTKEEREKRRPQRPVVEHVVDKYIKINKNNKWGFADRSGKEVIRPEYDEVFQFHGDICCVEKNELFGYIDRKGNVIIEPQYEMAASFSEGYACVCKGGECGYIDVNNNVVVPFIYEAGTPVVDGSCRVKKLGKWGELHIDKPDEVRWII